MASYQDQVALPKCGRSNTAGRVDRRISEARLAELMTILPRSLGLSASGIEPVAPNGAPEAEDPGHPLHEKCAPIHKKRCNQAQQYWKHDMKNTLIRAGALAVTMVVPVALHAQDVDGEMAVTAEVTRTCTVDASSLDFGEVSVDEATLATATIDISCTSGSLTATPRIIVSMGGNALEGTRQMIGGDGEGGAFIPYEIKASETGDDLGSDDNVSLTDSGNAGLVYTTELYGEITDSTEYQLGSYTDTVTVTITYDE